MLTENDRIQLRREAGGHGAMLQRIQPGNLPLFVLVILLKVYMAVLFAGVTGYTAREF